MKDKSNFYYRRRNPFGFDQITILAWSKEQADKIISETVFKPEEWQFQNFERIKLEMKN